MCLSLGLLEDSEAGLLAFISDVSLSAHVVWSGGLRVTWVRAEARALPSHSRAADMYKLVLRVGEGETMMMMNDKYQVTPINIPDPKFVMATNLSGEQTSHQFGGLALGQVYTISLACVFGAQEFSCGSVRLSTEAPDLVTQEPVIGTVQVYSLQTPEEHLVMQVIPSWAAAVSFLIPHFSSLSTLLLISSLRGL